MTVAAAGAQANPDSAAGTGTGTGTTTPDAKTADQVAADTAAAAAAATAAAAAAAAGTGTGKTEGTASKEPGSKDGTATPEPKAPEKYELKVPDTSKAYVDKADLEYLEQVARANKWSNDDAQAALEEHVTTVKAQADRYAAETKADKTYGGDKFDETQRLARTVIDRIRPAGHERRDSFLAFLGRGGAGNHIEVISFLADLGKQMGEDAPAASRSTDSSGGDAASKLYDHPTSKAGG